MHNPFQLATQRIINRLGRVVKLTTPLGEEIEVKAVLTNPQTTGFIRRVGKGSGGLDFKANAKRLRVMTKDVPGLSQEWLIVVNGDEYFPADHENDGRDGSTLIYLSRQQPKSPEAPSNGWR